MNVLVAPLNWGLGHASRCVPIIRRELAVGNKVTIAGDGESLALLRKHFPELPVIHLPHLNLHYGNGKSQVWTLIKQLPHIISWMIADHRTLKQILVYQRFDRIISDNRFTLYSKEIDSIYITHQICVRLPQGWRWLETLAHQIHLAFIKKYNECWIPDYPNSRLSGELTARYSLPKNARFIGPLSRFVDLKTQNLIHKDYDVVALLSGLEPQRTIFEQQIMQEYAGKNLLLVRGKINEPFCKIQKGSITIVPYLNDDDLVVALRGAETIIARSGYSTIMDFDALGVLLKARLIPTPGQSEQEYLADYHAWKK